MSDSDLLPEDPRTCLLPEAPIVKRLAARKQPGPPVSTRTPSEDAALLAQGALAQAARDYEVHEILPDVAQVAKWLSVATAAKSKGDTPKDASEYDLSRLTDEEAQTLNALCEKARRR